MSVVVDALNDPELAAVGAALRAEWRTDEEEWARAAFDRWQHGQTFLDVVRDCMHRGDTVAMAMHSIHRTFEGVVLTVGEDIVRITTSDGPVIVHVNADAPLALRVVRRARAGGGRGDREPATLRAALLDLEAGRARIELGVASADAVLTGELRVGRDQVAIRDADGVETYVLTRWVMWVRSSCR